MRRLRHEAVPAGREGRTGGNTHRIHALIKCCVSVIGIGEKASRKEVARGEAKTTQDGVQHVRLGVLDRPEAFLEATLEFCASAWEPK